MRVQICRLVVMAMPLAGCAAGLESQSLFVQPGKYQFLRCQDLAQRSVATAKREQELTSLMERAAQGTGGGVVNTMVYGPEFRQVQADGRELQQAAHEKNCDVPKNSPTPAAH
jgi:hypothetical protein